MMRTRTGGRLALAFASSALGACASTASLTGPVRVGQTAYVNGPRVRVDRIIEDSRCPADVQCIQAGRLILRVTVLGGGWRKQVDLTLGTPIQIADGQLTLIGALPKPMTGAHDRGLSPHRFKFDFQGGL